MSVNQHIKVKGEKLPYDGELGYWAGRLGRHPELSARVSKLLKKQKAKCNHCGLIFRDGDVWEVDHIIPRSLGGTNGDNNLQLLHRHCHDTKTGLDGSLNLRCTHDKG